MKVAKEGKGRVELLEATSSGYQRRSQVVIRGEAKRLLEASAGSGRASVRTFYRMNRLASPLIRGEASQEFRRSGTEAKSRK